MPQPVGTPQPTRTAVSSGSQSSTLTTEYWEIVARSENVPTRHMAPMSSPPAWNRAVPSGISPSRVPSPRSHRLCRPVEQYRQVPQLGMKLHTT